MSIAAFSPIPGVPTSYGSPGDMPLLGAEPGGGYARASRLGELGTSLGYGVPVEYERPEHESGELYTFSRDFYDRLHLSTALIALGNVIGQQSRTVTVWNAYRRSQLLAAIIAENTEGITLGGQPAPPLNYAPLEERAYEVTISTSGPPTIDASITWDFAPYDLVLRLTGSRITAWTFLPDWSRSILERLEWRTDVLRSYDGSEQRRQIRLAPRKRYEFEVFFQGKARRYAEAVIWGWGARTWALPIWPDGQELPSALTADATTIPCDPATRDFDEGSFAILLLDAFTFEIVEIAQVLSDRLELVRGTTRAWPAGTRLYPARIARLEGSASLPRWDGQAARMRAAFSLEGSIDHEADAGPVEYRGFPVLEHKPNWVGGFDIELERKLAELDSISGVRAFDDEAEMPFSKQRMRWTWATREEQQTYRKLLYALAGRLGALWVPTWEDDLRVVALIGDTSQTIDVEWTGYTLQLSGHPNRRDIRIELVDGTVFYRRIVGSQEVDADTERLGIDAPLGRNVPPEEVAKVSFLALSRLETDTVELEHWTGEVSQSQTVFRSFRHDL